MVWQPLPGLGIAENAQVTSYGRKIHHTLTLTHLTFEP